MQQAETADSTAGTGASSGKWTNIIRLPGAAARKVKQGGVQAVRDYRRANPWPGEYMLPSMRDGQRFAELTRSPELLVAMAIVASLPPEQQRKAKDIVHRVFWASRDDASWRASMLMAALGTELRA